MFLSVIYMLGILFKSSLKFDEPTGNLDEHTADIVLGEFKSP